MNEKRVTGKIKTVKMAIRMAAYLLAVTLVFSAVSVLCTVNAPDAPSPYNGAVDLIGVDLGNEIVTIQNTSFTMYPGAFYTPEDFTAGKVTQAGVLYDTPGVALSDYGTLRILLTLPPGEVYAIAGKNVSYAQRLFIDGKEYEPIGVTGDSIEAVTPKTTRFVEAFQPTGDTTEIVIQYSAFVYADGGGLYPFVIGLVRNVARYEQLKVFQNTAVAAALVTAALFFFGLFLFFPKSRYLLWFALICVCVALRGLLTSDKYIMLLLPNLDWYLAVRLEFATNCGMALFAALYLNSLFPGVAHRWLVRGFAAFCASHLLFISLTPPAYFTRYTAWLVGGYAVFISCLLLAVLIAALRKKLTSPLSGAEQILLLFGLVVYASLSVFGIYAHQNSISLWGLDYPQIGVMIFLFLNIPALVLGFARTERELDEARKIEREMEETNKTLKRLNRVRTIFLSNFSHELKTPLAGINSMAQYIQVKLRSGVLDEEVDSNLCDITDRSKWLADYVDRLLKLSVEQEDMLDFAAVPIVPLLRQAAAVADPLLKERGNRLTIKADKPLPPLSGVADMLLRVLTNLIGNANRHSEGSEILLTASADGGMAEIRVTDHGSGIRPDILPKVFLRGVSGDGGSGIGIGLAICKEIVETHGGMVHITSSLGSGTEVWFTIPFAKEGIQ